MPARMTFTGSIVEISRSVDRHGDRVLEAARHYAEQTANDMEAHARGHHRWRNRTGRAEAGLDGWVDAGSDHIRIYLAQRHPDRKWLEIAMGKRWAIVGPTMRKFAPTFRQWMTRHGFAAG